MRIHASPTKNRNGVCDGVYDSTHLGILARPEGSQSAATQEICAAVHLPSVSEECINGEKHKTTRCIKDGRTVVFIALEGGTSASVAAMSLSSSAMTMAWHIVARNSWK